ncbi:MAG: LPXTG cell wall anchor domain-containing protein, partial [Oscillospiraceae bacterium]|nr:LPXTG cell wall anchor domain-containing protein [Oscillospiraceae bacterium]
SPEVGDVAFIDTDLDGRADVTAIVVSIGDTIIVIQGNYNDTVALIEYPVGDSIIGYANVTYTSEEEAEEDEEITLDESDEIIAEEIEELDVSAEDLATLKFVGTDYIITVSYGEDAALPEGTELVAYEYAQDSENFLARYAEAAELYGWGDSDETDPYHGFRLFNIGLYYDGTEIEPAASVTVTVTYTGKGVDMDSVYVTHFGDTATETLDATLTDGAVTFTADGFSEYGIMLTSLAAGVKTVLFSELTDTQLDALQIEIDNTITEDGKLTAYLYYLDGNEKVYVYDYVYDANGDPTSDTTYFISSYEDEGVDYTVTYTWYRSKEPYLTDSIGTREDAPDKGIKTISNKKTSTDTSTTTITNYNYLTSTSNSFGAAVSENYCSVINGSNIYLFYYYYVGVSITYIDSSSGKDVTTEVYGYESDDEDTVYATLDDDNNTLGSVARYVTITNSNNTLTAKLYDSEGNVVDPGSNDNFTYTFTWYKSRTYEAADGTTVANAPYANTVANTNDYAVISGETSSSLKLTYKDSFYFYYLQVTLKYKVYNSETGNYDTYTTTVKGYEAWKYAGLIVDSTSGDYTAVIIDDLASSGTFKAVLYDKDGNIVPGTDYSWSKSESEYVITTTYTNTTGANTSIYSDQNVPEDISYSTVTDTTQSGIFTTDGDAVYIAKNFGALHYYKVTITYNGMKYESAPKYVQYSDEIENGGFEIGSTTSSSEQVNDLYVAYWHTTNGEYSENHGTYRGYNSIEIGYYGGSTALGTYAIAYTKGGNAARNYFVELNATEASTLYQSVITAPKTIYYWSVYHQNRSYSVSNVSTTDEGIQQNGYYRRTTEGTGTDSMYVIIMSDADAELLLADVDEDNESYDEQQEVIDAAAAAVAVGTNWHEDEYMESSETYGTIDGYYDGYYTLQTGTSAGKTVHLTLWQVTTTKTVTRVTFYTDDTYKTYADVSSLADTYYLASDGWAPYTATVNGTTTTVGYYQVTDWVKYEGSYTVPEGQYLTRFFFAAAYAQGGTSNGNFIDGVSLTYAIDYTIEYWVWDYEKCEYVKKDYEEGSATPYVTVNATKTGDYAAYGLVGSVTSYQSGGENPKSFDSTKNTSLYVDAYNYVLSLYYGGPGVIVDKVISGVSTAALDALDTTVNFTVTDKMDGTNTATLDVNVKGAASGESSAELKEGTYTIIESDCSSLFNGKYVWVDMDVTGATYNSSSGKYEFEITSTDPLPTVTYTNYYLPVVTLKKVESAYNTALSGVTFAMYTKDSNDEISGYYLLDNSTVTWDSNEQTQTTNADGIIAYSALPDGTYYLSEISTADGYNLLTEELWFTIGDGTITAVKDSKYISIDDSSDSYGLTILVKNDPGVELPETGGISLPVAYAVGSLMILASAIGLVVRRKKI